ncbi:hypothetical protein [Ruegeria sp.]|uniref:hypothetical protein n=1 Tax=Ruegeria sp. TaxID=1879320 RepID=UPI003C7D3D8B
MPCRHDSAEAYIQETNWKRGELKAPRDGAIFYTNGGQETARAYMIEQNENQQNMTILEETKHGKRLDEDKLYEATDDNYAKLERKQAERLSKELGRPISPYGRRGADRVWDHASNTYAKQASGRVTVITNSEEIKETSAFARQERNTLIRNEEVTHINGVDRKELLAKLNQVENARNLEKAERRRELNAMIESNAPMPAKGVHNSDRQKNEQLEPVKNRYDSQVKSKQPTTPSLRKNKSK